MPLVVTSAGVSVHAIALASFQSSPLFGLTNPMMPNTAITTTAIMTPETVIALSLRIGGSTTFGSPVTRAARARRFWKR